MIQSLKILKILFVSIVITFSFTAFADEGELSGDEMDDIFDDVNHGSTGEGSSDSSPSQGDLEDSHPAPTPVAAVDEAAAREKVDDDEDASSEINNLVGDSLTESNSFQSHTPEPEVTADQFIHGRGANSFSGSSDPGSFNYQPEKKKQKVTQSKSKTKAKAKSKSKKQLAKKSKKGKKIAKAAKSKSKSRKVASSKKPKNKRYR